MNKITKVFLCAVCDIKCPSAEHLIGHQKTTRHINRLKLAGVYPLVGRKNSIISHPENQSRSYAAVAKGNDWPMLPSKSSITTTTKSLPTTTNNHPITPLPSKASITTDLLTLTNNPPVTHDGRSFGVGEGERMYLGERTRLEEGPTVEFKASFDIRHSKQYRSTMNAFLNTKGGVIYFGIRDDGLILGNVSHFCESQRRGQVDAFRLWVDQTQRAEFFPAVYSISVRIIKLTSNTDVWAIVVPKSSLAEPVWFQNTIYKRLNASTVLVSRNQFNVLAQIDRSPKSISPTTEKSKEIETTRILKAVASEKSQESEIKKTIAQEVYDALLINTQKTKAEYESALAESIMWRKKYDTINEQHELDLAEIILWQKKYNTLNEQHQLLSSMTRSLIARVSSNR